ncbi:MAG: MBOAT family protein [Spirochaetes bacterium]|nr:MBOAT family protein [Spirochaetota bacterium]
MSLVSFQYLVFFTIVVAIFFVVPQRFKWIYLLIASYFFYMWWDPKYAILIMTTTIVVYATGLLMHNRTDRIRKLCVALSVAINLGILFMFKYFVFFNNSIRDLTAFFGGTYTPPVLNLLLPVGLSFYTFQALSYTVDVYRGTREPERHFGMFALYVSFFPTLLSGPIERSTRLLPQLYKKVEFDYERVVNGLILMAWGFFQKLVIADRIGQYVAMVFNQPQYFDGLPVLMAIYLHGILVYADFSGYTDIAIGTAQVMGYELMPNFRRPFLAASIGDLWRRWHISLITWFRDYLYIPLGGNKGSKFRWHLNTVIVFTLSGLWHGANWPLVVWGALNGIFIVISRLTAKIRGAVRETFFGTMAKVPPAVYFALFAVAAAAAGFGKTIGMGLGGRIGAGAAALFLLPVAVLSTRKEMFPRFLEGLKKAVMIIITYHLFVFGGIYFRAKTMADGWYMLTHFWGTNFIQLPLFFGLQEFGFMLLLVVFLCVVNYIQESRGSIREMIRKRPLVVRWALYYLMVMSIFAGMLKTAQFIYFQF